MPAATAALVVCKHNYRQKRGTLLKQRIISALVGVIILFIVLGLFKTPVFNLAIAFLMAVAAYEIAKTVAPGQPEMLRAFSMLFGALAAFANLPALVLLVLVYVVVMFAAAISRYPKVDVAALGLQVMMTIGVVACFYCVLLLREKADNILLALYYIFMIFSSAWLSDIGAFLVGCRFGKRKLAPTVSPKKSVEGLWGGLAFGVLGNLLFSWLFASVLAGYAGVTLSINYLYVALVSPVLVLLGVLGDLSASMVKRTYGIKDYGNLMPGHGGVMDRFDSFLYVAPLVYFLMVNFPFAV